MTWVESDGDEWKGATQPEKTGAYNPDSEGGSGKNREDYAMAVANLLSPHDFLVLQMMALELGLFEITALLERPVNDVKQSMDIVHDLIAEKYGTLHEESFMEVLVELSEDGHRKPCPRCTDLLCDDDAFCMECAHRNPHFNLRTFKFLWEHSYAEARRQECAAGHPLAKELGRTCFCELCGIDLEPITSKRPQ